MILLKVKKNMFVSFVIIDFSVSVVFWILMMCFGCGLVWIIGVGGGLCLVENVELNLGMFV